jgi:hypothetical protein
MDKKKEQVEKVPNGVKVVSMIYFIGAIFLIIFGTTAVLVSANSGYTPIILTFIILLSLVISCFIISKGLWKLKPWARIAAIILLILIMIFTMIIIFEDMTFVSYLFIAIGLGIIAYLLFNKKAKEAFKK